MYVLIVTYKMTADENELLAISGTTYQIVIFMSNIVHGPIQMNKIHI